MVPRAVLRLLAAAVALPLLAPAWVDPVAAAQPRPHKTVLAVYWSPEEFPANRARDAAIREALSSPSDTAVEYFAEYLESDRFPEVDASEALRDYIRRKYRGRRIDVVLAITDVSLQFVLRHRDELFPDAPIVYFGAVAPDMDVRSAGPGLTGLVTSAGFAETLELALRLHPSTERVLVVARWPDLEPEALKEELRRFAQRVELSYVTDEPVPRLIEAVEAAPPRGLILYIRYSDENSATGAESTDVARRIVQASSVPVYGVAEGFIGSGVIGGAVFSTTGIATRIGQITRQILDGTLARDIPIQRATLVPMFDWRQLKRWGIAVDSLPPDSVLLFREISVWERYRGTILLTASVLLLQSLLIAGLVFEHRRRRRAEIESRRHLAAMAHLDRRAAMGELATSLAHELSQPLNAILQNAGVAQMLLTSATVPPALEEMADIIGDIRKDDIRASEVIRRMRGLLLKRELEAHPVDLNEVAQDAVAIVRPDARARAIDLETKLADDVSPIIVGDRVHLQQVLLNLLMNAMDAVATMPPERRRVHVSTTRRDDEVRLAVADSGVGIPADRLAEIFEPFYTTKGDDRGMGMGLAIARSIVEAHAGSMAAENNPGGGATVWFSVPATQGPPS